MGTRADFWVGHGPQAEWLGSIALDGYQWAEQPEHQLMIASTEGLFRAAVIDAMSENRYATRPEQGWPWPWENSSLTDFAYVFDAGRVHIYCFGRPYVRHEAEDDEQQPKRTDWRDMSDVKNVTMGPRSGAIVISGGRIVGDD